MGDTIVVTEDGKEPIKVSSPGLQGPKGPAGPQGPQGPAVLVKLDTIVVDFDMPIFVEPGEFVQCVKKKVGTAPSAGVIAHVISYDYGWE
jgi:hypothetical protein